MGAFLTHEPAKKNLFQPRNFEDMFAHLDEAPFVLIVDDDLDAALALEGVFRQFGCETAIAANVSDAQKHMLSRKADLVILDWLLDRDASGESLLKSVNQKLTRFFSQPFGEEEKTTIVTHSCLAADEINVPTSSFYSHFGHWQKPIQRPNLIKKISALLTSIPG